MPRNLDDPAWVELQKKVSEVLAPFAPFFGARQCTHEENWGDCEEEDCTFGDTQPKPNSMPVIQHFLLIAATTDMSEAASDAAVIIAIDGVNQPGYASRGLANDYLFT